MLFLLADIGRTSVSTGLPLLQFSDCLASLPIKLDKTIEQGCSRDAPLCKSSAYLIKIGSYITEV